MMNLNSILITTSSFGSENKEPLEMLQAAPLNIVLNPFKRKLTEDELIALLVKHKPKYLIAGTETIGRMTLEIAKPYLQMISRCGTGVDNVDIRAARDIGIKVANTPDAPVRAVAELTIGIMLDLLRGISNADRNMRIGNFDKHMGNLLFGKTVGLIGCGRIGTAVAKLLLGFGCHVIGYDKFINTHEIIDLITLNELWNVADIISLHIPFTDDNKCIVDALAIDKMKDGVILLNVSRGGLIDERALYSALINGKIKAAGMDCFEKEPYSDDLIELSNVVLTPHIGSYAIEARIEQETAAVKNILEYIGNE
jgi:D-3-phosphoglycerate dehydrogenase